MRARSSSFGQIARPLRCLAFAESLDDDPHVEALAGVIAQAKSILGLCVFASALARPPEEQHVAVRVDDFKTAQPIILPVFGYDR